MKRAQVCYRVYCSSDWHNPPDRLKESVRAFIQEARKGQREALEKGQRVLVVGVGDLFELMLDGWESFIDAPAIHRLIEELGDLEFVYLAGNHDPLPWIEEVMVRSGQQMRPLPGFGLELEGARYYFHHGHRWDMRARWIRVFTPLLMWLGSRGWLRGFLRWWTERMNPGGLKARVKRLEAERDSQPRGSDEWARLSRMLEGERQRYNERIGWVHAGAGKHAEITGRVVICGHTHKPWRAAGFEGPTPVLCVHDDGDLVDSFTYLVIDASGVKLHTLGELQGARPAAR